SNMIEGVFAKGFKKASHLFKGIG
nr:antimicrobial peptide {immobilized peptide E23GIG magainin2} [synthetic, Peptide Synthetic, 23 aa] [synthetic construct]